MRIIAPNSQLLSMEASDDPACPCLKGLAASRTPAQRRPALRSLHKPECGDSRGDLSCTPTERCGGGAHLGALAGTTWPQREHWSDADQHSSRTRPQPDCRSTV